ncbi:hypothetical protein ABZP36_011734 [Zizania latifolia]
MPDMDGFKLLEHIGLEIDLPVIMMSIDGETSRVMKDVQHGACDYLLKPVRMKEHGLNIWQHVYRKKMHEVKEIEGHDSCDDLQILRNGFEGLDEKSLFMISDTMRKRKDVDKDHVDQESSDGTTVKKAGVVWSVDLHQRFVDAVTKLDLTKYCLYLSRLQKQNEERILGTARQDFSHKGTSENLNLRSSFQEQPSNIANGYPHASQNIQTQTNMLGSQLEDTKRQPVQVYASDERYFRSFQVASLMNILHGELAKGVGNYIRRCQIYEGGIAGEPFAEAHGRCTGGMTSTGQEN